MEALIAGWTAGFAMALVSTATLVYLLVGHEDAPFVRLLLPEQLPPAIAAVPISVAMMLGWPLVGLLFGGGFALFGPEDGDSPVPSVPYLIGIVATGLVPLVFLMLFWPRRWWLWTGMTAVFVALFGVAMPLLATR